MSINRSLYIGLSGMNANSQALNIVSDNIANMNTVGYKGGRSIFQEMLGQTLMGSAGSSMAGGGVGLARVDRMFQQGALLGTGGEFDMAISGDGFFPVQGDVTGTSGMFYTRAGQFGKNADGFITTPHGLKLMGYPASSDGSIQAGLQALQIDDSPLAPEATTEAKMKINLDPKAKVFDSEPFDPQNPGATSNFQASVTVYDNQGSAYQVDVYFRRTGDKQWEYNAVLDGQHVDGGIPGENAIVGSTGFLSFDDSGKLQGDLNVSDIGFTPKGASNPVSISLDLTGSTEWGDSDAQTDDSAVVDISANGSESGTFQHVTIAADGTITGTFSTGAEKVLGQVAVARFNANGGLANKGAGLYAGTMQSGDPIFGAPNAGGRGAIMSGSLEQSTVDLAAEFTNMIIAQRGYQANSRTITTADQVIQEAVNLKR